MSKRYPTPDEKRQHCSRRIEQARDAGIELFRFRASNMAAGPCPRAAEMNEARIPIDQIEPVPFFECPHPDQCACMYQAWLAIADE